MWYALPNALSSAARTRPTTAAWRLPCGSRATSKPSSSSTRSSGPKMPTSTRRSYRTRVIRQRGSGGAFMAYATIRQPRLGLNVAVWRRGMATRIDCTLSGGGRRRNRHVSSLRAAARGGTGQKGWRDDEDEEIAVVAGGGGWGRGARGRRQREARRPATGRRSGAHRW